MAPHRERRRLREVLGALSPRELALVAIPSALIMLAVFYAAYRLVDPAPPRKIVMSTATPDSGYVIFARRYQERLAKDGVELEIRFSAGSLQNLARLRDPASGVQAALTTTGAAPAADAEMLASLGGLFYSPIFVFYRANKAVDRFVEFRGRRISISAPGTFVRAYARQILELSGAIGPDTPLRELENDAALAALVAREIDVAIFPSTLDAPVVRRALATQGVRLMSSAQADAISKQVPVLSHIVMPRGLISLERDEPPTDLHMLATVNSLIVRKDLHPALQYLLLEAVKEVHGTTGPFNRLGDFPAAYPQDLPLSQQAERFYRSGRPWIYGYARFWVAVLLDRLIFILIPVIAVLIPILRFAPVIYLWLHRHRIWRLHRELTALELELAADGTAVRDDLAHRLAVLEDQVSALFVPLPFENELFHLRNHLHLLRQRLRQM